MTKSEDQWRAHAIKLIMKGYVNNLQEINIFLKYSLLIWNATQPYLGNLIFNLPFDNTEFEF